MTQNLAIGPKRKIINRRDRSGVTTVEFALVAPVIFVVFLGAIEIANMNYCRNLANDTCYQVARAAIVPGADISSIEADAREGLEAVGITDATIDTRDIAGDSIEVEVTIPLDQNSWGIGRFTSGWTIAQRCQLARQFSSE